MCPPDYSAPTGTINGIRLLHPTAAILANNHILDQKTEGLRSTMEVLAQNGIAYVGAGNNIAEAKKPMIIDHQNLRTGIYACCEKEFSFATEDTAGANVFDPLETFDEISELKKACDYLAVLFHGGMQGYPYPTPYQQKVCRKMCESGADLVVCQHSHITGCEEIYGNGRIVYGQGNFLLDDVSDESWKTGLIIRVETEAGKISVSYFPTLTQNHKVILHPDGDQVRKGFDDRSREIGKPGTVERLFEDHCEKKLSDYLLKLSGKSSLIQRIYGRLGITRHYEKLYSEEACNRILDYLYCDSHREAIEYGLNRFLRKKRNK